MVKKILKNRYLKHTKISEATFRLVLKHFCLDDTVDRTSEEVGLSRKAVLRLFGLLRQYIFEMCKKESAFSGEIEVDESYFGSRRVRGKRGRGARGKILSKSTVYSDGWRSYEGLIYQGYHHYRIHYNENEFARGKNHINGIESFWSFTKARLLKMKGVRKDKFVLHLKESEFRWNYRKQMYQKLLETIRKSPIIGD
jgi:transposase